MRKLSISAFAAVLVLTPIGASAQPRQANLPDGVGKDLVEGLCTGCHSANQIVRSSGYTEEEWTEHISSDGRLGRHAEGAVGDCPVSGCQHAA